MYIRINDRHENMIHSYEDVVLFEYEYQEYNGKTFWLHIYPRDEHDFYLEINPREVEIVITK